MIVRVPQQQAAVAEPGEVERVRDQRHGVRDVPLLAQHHHRVAAVDGRPDEVLDQRVRQAAVEIRHLVVFAVVDPDRVVAADPLAPAVQPELAVERALVRREGGITNEEQVRLEATLGQRPRQLFDADSEPTSLRVDVRALEGEDDEGRLLGLEHQATRSATSWRAKAWTSADSDASRVVLESSRTDTSSRRPPS